MGRDEPLSNVGVVHLGCYFLFVVGSGTMADILSTHRSTDLIRSGDTLGESWLDSVLLDISRIRFYRVRIDEALWITC